MRRVGRPLSNQPAAITAKVQELCDATTEHTEEIADGYEITTPSGFTPVRTLDLTASPTAAQVAAVLATFLLDLKNRGINRKPTNNA